MANVADTIISIVRETVPGTTPDTPVFKYLDQSESNFVLASTTLSSDIIRSNRAPGDSAEQGFHITGNITTDFCRDTSLDLLLESAMGNTFTAGVLKAGKADLFQTIEQRMTFKNGNLGYFRNTGMQATSFDLNIDAVSKATASFELMGFAQTNSSTMMTGATYTAPTKGPLYTGGGAGAITVSGFSGMFYSLALNVSHTRSPRFGLFNPNSFGNSTTGNRQITLTLTMYRDDFEPEAVFLPNTPLSVGFSLGTGAGNVTTFNGPRMFKTGITRVANNDEFVQVVLTNADDTTSGTDFIITKS